MNYRKVIIIVVFILFTFVAGDLIAQCPMCRMSAESNLANGGNMAKGLNKGILYLFALPYLLIGTFVFLWWKKHRNHS